MSILVKMKYHKNSINRPHSNKCPSPDLDAPNGHLSVSFGIPEKKKYVMFLLKTLTVGTQSDSKEYP